MHLTYLIPNNVDNMMELLELCYVIGKEFIDVMPQDVFQFSDLCSSRTRHMITLRNVNAGNSVYDYFKIPQTAIARGHDVESLELQGLVISCCEFYTVNSRIPLDVEDELPLQKLERLNLAANKVSSDNANRVAFLFGTRDDSTPAASTTLLTAERAEDISKKEAEIQKRDEEKDKVIKRKRKSGESGTKKRKLVAQHTPMEIGRQGVDGEAEDELQGIEPATLFVSSFETTLKTVNSLMTSMVSADEEDSEVRAKFEKEFFTVLQDVGKTNTLIKALINENGITKPERVRNLSSTGVLQAIANTVQDRFDLKDLAISWNKLSEIKSFKNDCAEHFSPVTKFPTPIL